MSNRPSILCFGEMLWDSLPAGLFPGGAPFNVAYHLHQLDATVYLLSGLGKDKLGHELARRLAAWGLSTTHITFHTGLPTGTTVARTTPSSGEVTYEIVSSVAWDQIVVETPALQLASQAQAIVFGSLAQRSSFNQAALQRLLAALPDQAWRVLDVNLRAPHDDLPQVRELARSATLLKLTAEEATRLVLDTTPAQPGAEEIMARALAHDCGCRAVCITNGPHGAGLLLEDHWHWEEGRAVQVVDTVGAGDAFLARLLSHFLADNLTPAQSLASACRHGEWVASRFGATPIY